MKTRRQKSQSAINKARKDRAISTWESGESILLQVVDALKSGRPVNTRKVAERVAEANELIQLSELLDFSTITKCPNCGYRLAPEEPEVEGDDDTDMEMYYLQDDRPNEVW